MDKTVKTELQNKAYLAALAWLPGDWIGGDSWLDTTGEPTLVVRAVLFDFNRLRFYRMDGQATGPQDPRPDMLDKLRERLYEVRWQSWDMTTTKITRAEALDLLSACEDKNLDLMATLGLTVEA